MVADATGLSKSAVQNGMRALLRRHLVRVQRESVTAVPEYRIALPWNRKVKLLLVSQGRQRIHARGAQCRKVARKERDHC